MLMIIAVAYFENSLKLGTYYLCMTQRAFCYCHRHYLCSRGEVLIHRDASSQIYAAYRYVAIAGSISGKQLWLQSLPRIRCPPAVFPSIIYSIVFPQTGAAKHVTAR